MIDLDKDQELCDHCPPPPDCGEEKSIFVKEYNAFSKVEIRPNGCVRMSGHGLCVELLPEKWVRLYTDAIAESVHIDKMLEAIAWYFGPSDVLKIRKRYLELLNKPGYHVGPFE